MTTFYESFREVLDKIKDNERQVVINELSARLSFFEIINTVV